ncbi:MAG: sigma factor-like helix-turn-helix DNA-binding protein [Ilumatobacteraceae bacterium]
MREAYSTDEPATSTDEAHLTADLYREHAARLRGLASAITLDRSMGEEVVHDVFAGLAGRLQEIRNPTAYLQRSVVNRSIQLLSRRDLARRAPLAPVRHQVAPEIDEMWTLVAALPARQRAVVVLRFWDDLSYEQIATVLDPARDGPVNAAPCAVQPEGAPLMTLQELEAELGPRLRRTLDEMIDETPPTPERLPAPGGSPRRSRVLSIAAAASVVSLVGGLLAISRRTEEPEAPSLGTSSLSSVAVPTSPPSSSAAETTLVAPSTATATSAPTQSLPTPITWTQAPDTGSLARSAVAGVVSGPTGFVATGMGFDDGRNQGRVWFSRDGMAWEEPAFDLFDAKAVGLPAATSEAFYVVAATKRSHARDRRRGRRRTAGRATVPIDRWTGLGAVGRCARGVPADRSDAGSSDAQRPSGRSVVERRRPELVRQRPSKAASRRTSTSTRTT